MQQCYKIIYGVISFMRKLKVGLIQTDSKLLDIDYNLSLAEGLIRKCANLGAKIVCLPELFSYGYYLPVLSENLEQLAEEKKGKTVTCLCSLAKELEIYICAGVIIKEQGKIYNSAVFINDDGTVQFFYHKNHLFGNENQCFEYGKGYMVADTRFGKIGVIICYDNNFPESARINALMGAELILCPCAWRIEEKDIFYLLSQSHACENGVYLCCVNMYGQYKDLTLFGGSVLCDPRGQIISKCNKGNDISCCEIDLDLCNQVHKNRRSEIYTAICENKL